MNLGIDIELPCDRTNFESKRPAGQHMSSRKKHDQMHSDGLDFDLKRPGVLASASRNTYGTIWEVMKKYFVLNEALSLDEPIY